MLKAAGAGGFLMLLAFDKKNNGFISIKNVLTQDRCYTFELLNGETLATISFEELCAGGLGRGGESFRLLLG